MIQRRDPLMDAIFIEKIRRARAGKEAGILSLDGLDLFEEALILARDGVRNQSPQATDAEIEVEVERRIAIKRQIDEHGFYQSIA